MSGQTPENLANILGALATLISDQSKAVLTEGKESESDQVALLLISKNSGGAIKDLQHALKMTHSGCVRLVKRLESRDLIKRQEHDDARAVSLSLTRRGQMAALHGFQRREDALMSLVSVLSSKEQGALFGIASKLLSVGATQERIGRTCRMCDHDTCTTCPFDGFCEGAAP